MYDPVQNIGGMLGILAGILDTLLQMMLLPLFTVLHLPLPTIFSAHA